MQAHNTPFVLSIAMGSMTPEQMQAIESILGAEEQREREIMTLLLKIKNGTPPMRKVSEGILHFGTIM